MSYIWGINAKSKGVKVQSKKSRVCKVQKVKDIGPIFKSSGCAGAHSHSTLDPPLAEISLDSLVIVTDMLPDGCPCISSYRGILGLYSNFYRLFSR